MEQTAGKKILIIYSSRSSGRHTVTGPATKTAYGYRKQGDKFEVFEADMRVRPDLFRAANPRPVSNKIVARRGGGKAPAGQPTPMPVKVTTPLAADAPPPPPIKITPLGKKDPVTPEEIAEAESVLPDDKLLWPLTELDWSGTRVNKGHLKTLADNGIKRLTDLEKTNEAQLVEVDGIGPATVTAVYAQYYKYK